MNPQMLCLKRRWALLVCFIVLVVSLALPSLAWAHPLGNFTINQYTGLQISSTDISLEYIVDMAEIPAFQEIATFDVNGNGQPETFEAAAYHGRKCASLQPDLELRLDSRPVDLSLASSSVVFPVGAGGLPTLRLTCEFRAAAGSIQENARISFDNRAFPERLGWKEIVVTDAGPSLSGDFATTSLSNRLTLYPRDLLTGPLDQRQVSFEMSALGSTGQAPAPFAAGQPVSPLAGRNDQFTRLILLDEITLSTVLIALAASFLWGAMHALTPGHGKTIVGAYLVGSRGTPKHALYLGLTTTLTHTLGVFALGLITLFAARFIVPEKMYPWMSFLSGLFVVGIGANLLISRIRSAGLGKPPVRLPVNRGGAAYMQMASHALSQHSHSDGSFHTHAPAHLFQPARYPHPHTYGSAPFHDHRHEDSHASGGHTHLPPGTDGSPVTWRSLLLLGISGGIIPCPSALVVLLGAIALDRIGLGLLLVVAFSLGLAAALTAIGLMFIYAGRVFERIPARGKITRLLPVFSALFVALVGLVITVRALQEMGLVK